MFVCTVLCRWQADSWEERRGWQREVSIWSFPEIRFHHVWWVSIIQQIRNWRGLNNTAKCFHLYLCVDCRVLPENNLYSATSINFLGSEPVLMRSNPVTIRTEFKSSWLNGKLWLLRFYIHSLWPVVILIPSVKFHISSLCARAHLCFHDSDAREWDECRGRRRQGLPFLQWDSRGVRLLQQTGGLPRGPCLQGERVHRAYTYFRCSCISQKDNNVKTAFPLFCSLSPFRWLIVHPVCFVFFVLVNVALWCLSVVTGGSWRSEDLAEEMDILPEGQNGLSSTRVSTAVHYSGHLPLVWLPTGLEGLFVLRRLHTTVVRLN